MKILFEKPSIASPSYLDRIEDHGVYFIVRLKGSITA